MKKIVGMFLILVMSVSVMFSGCALIEKDQAKYLNQVVAKGNNIELTMEDLLIGVNSWGSSIMEEHKDYKQKDVVNAVINRLVDNQILINFSKNKFGDLETWEKNDIYKAVFEAVNSEIADLESTIKIEMGVDSPATEQEQEEKKYAVEEKYEKKVEYNFNTQKYEIVEKEEPDRSQEKALNANSFEDYANLSGDAEIYAKAMSRYVRNIRNNAKDRGEEYSDKLSEKEVLSKEIDRMYEIYEEAPYNEQNAYIVKLANEYQKKYNLDFVNDEFVAEGKTQSALEEKIVEKYKNLVRDSFGKYSNDEEKYVKDMQNSAATVYWHVDGAVTNVSHILVQYTDEQKDEITKLKTDLSKGKITQDRYYSRLEEIQNSIRGKARDAQGKEIGASKSIQEIKDEITRTVNNATTLQEKAEAFNTLIYKYNQDPGVLNAKNYYAVPTKIEGEIKDTFVPEFAKASRELGVGEVSDYVFTEYGCHIIFNLGSPKSVLMDNIDKITARALYEERIMLGTEKTYFDEMFDLIYSMNQKEYFDTIVENNRNKLNITKYERVYNELY